MDKKLAPLVDPFRAVATDYCRTLEVARSGPALLLEMRRLLPALYAAATQLPEVEGTDNSNDDHGPTSEEVRARYVRLGELLGRSGLYWDVYDPAKEPTDEVVAGSLPDDLSDIWADLRRGFGFWELGLHEDAIWSWRFHWDFHWGAHAVDALRAIHWRLGPFSTEKVAKGMAG